MTFYKPFSLKAAVCGLFCLASVIPSVAQDPEHKLGNWIGATSSMRFSDKWSLFLQGGIENMGNGI